MQNLLRSHSEFRVYCFGNGVKLFEPEKAEKFQSTSFCYDTGYTVWSILQLNLNVTFLNLAGKTATINELSASTSGFVSVNDAIGKSIQDITTAESGEIIMGHNRKVMDHKQKGIFEETIFRKNNTSANVIAVKSPWYDCNNKIIGLFGCGLELGKLPLAESLALIAKVGMLNDKKLHHHQYFSGMIIEHEYFTKREKDILYLLVRGKTAKAIAAQLKLSARTVEAYLANLKLKMQVHNKTDLIDKVFDYFFLPRC